MEKQWIKWVECDEKEKDELIGILKANIAEKEIAIGHLTSDLVFAHKKIMNREAIIEVVREIVCNETPEWEYDTAWSRIVTKNSNGLQTIVLDQIEPELGQIIVERANKLIKEKNNKGDCI